MTYRYDPTRNDWPYPDDEDLTPDEREAYRAADILGIPIDGFQVIAAEKWATENESFERRTRKLVAAYRRDNG